VVLPSANPFAKIGKAISDPDAGWRSGIKRLAGQPPA
jgi:hypothetical protein